MKTSNKIFLGLLAAIALNVLTGMVLLRANLGPGSIGNGDISIQGTKDIKKVRLTASDFKGISVGGNFQVTLTQGAEEFVDIETDANLIGYFEVKVNEDKTLYIDAKEGYSLIPTHNVQVHIGFKDLEAIRTHGHSAISSDQALNFGNLALEIHNGSQMEFGVIAQDLKVRITGSSKNNVSGTTENLELNVFNSGKFEGQDLTVKNAKVSINNSGTADLKVIDALDCHYFKIKEYLDIAVILLPFNKNPIIQEGLSKIN